MDGFLTSLIFIDGVFLAWMIFAGKKGLNSTLIEEIFKLCGVLLGLVIAAHYYERFSSALEQYIKGHGQFMDVLGFTFIALLVIGLFYIIKEGWMIILKFDLPKGIDTWGGFCIALCKAFLISAMIFFVFMISSFDRVRDWQAQSLSRHVLQGVVPSVYQTFYDTVMSSMFKEETINKNVLQLPQIRAKKETP